MTIEDEFKTLVGGYYGVEEMDAYILKEYVLKDIEEYIKKFVAQNPIANYDYFKEAEQIKEHLPLKRKLQDSLLTLRKIEGPLELVLMIKEELEKLK